jgi:ribosome small subunit-dependent GTPase A
MLFPGLAGYGWDTEFETSFADYRETGVIPARVVRVDRGRCAIVTEHGPLTAADARLSPCTGDWVAVRTDAGEPILTAVLPRRTAIVRSSSSRRSDEQVLAANVDTVAVVVSLAAPLVLNRIERLLALAWDSGARPVVVLSKADQVPDPSAALVEVSTAAPGADVLAVSAVEGDGVEALLAVLSGTVVLLGPSGAGKSTLGNALLGSDRLAVGAVRDQDGKGRHTTVHRELVPLPHGGVLIDTPGLRGIGLWDTEEGVALTFPEIEELAAECRFGDCAHETEPGCAVLAAVETGELPARRLASYRKLLRENEWVASRTDARLRAERRGKWKAITKQMRRGYQGR